MRNALNEGFAFLSSEDLECEDVEEEELILKGRQALIL